MRHQHQQRTTVAILGANTLFDRILVRLLKDDEGYDTTLLEAYPTKFHNELLEGVDVLLLSPYLDTDVRWAFLEAMRRTPAAARRVPVLSLSVPLLMALQDELSVNVSWQSLFNGLVQEIDASLAGAEADVEEPSEGTGEPPKEEDLRSGAA